MFLSSIGAARRMGDALFQYRSDELVLLLTATDSESATSVARRIATNLWNESLFRIIATCGHVTLTIATAPRDGQTVRICDRIVRQRHPRSGTSQFRNALGALTTVSNDPASDAYKLGKFSEAARLIERRPKSNEDAVLSLQAPVLPGSRE